MYIDGWGVSMKFLIITCYGSYIIEAEDFQDAAEKAYDTHTKYNNVEAIVKLPEETLTE